MPIGLEGNFASCCMCFSIKTGCKIIGMLSLFFSAMHLMIYTMMLVQVETNLPRCYDMLERGETTDHLLLNNCFHQSIWLVRAALLLGCLLYLFGLIGSAMLLKGISKKLPKLFYAWFLFCTVIIVRNLMSYGTFHNLNDGMKNLLFSLILLYFFCIVKYHERELIVSNNDSYGPNQIGNTAMQEVVTTYPSGGLPKDNPPPYSVVVSAPPPYSSCVAYYPESQTMNPTALAEQSEGIRVDGATSTGQTDTTRVDCVTTSEEETGVRTDQSINIPDIPTTTPTRVVIPGTGTRTDQQSPTAEEVSDLQTPVSDKS